MNWRCRNCNRSFKTPMIETVVAAEWPGVELVYESRNLRRRTGSSRPVDQRGKGNYGCGCLLVILIAVGVAGFFAISNNADFPGATMLRTAGQEVSQRLEETGSDEDKQPAPSLAGGQTPSPTTTTAAVLPSATALAARPTPTPLPSATPADAPMPTPELLTNQRHYNYKAYMLELINEERNKAGVPSVTLGLNIAAQTHAEISLANCVSGHWGVDGLKPYMRYSLAGGYQSNSENSSGSDYCIKESDQYRALSSIEAEIREMMAGWMSSPGHRRNMLDKWHKKVSIGLAWDKYNLVAYQHFEGDYVQYTQPPEIINGTLSISGTTMNGLRFSGEDEFGLQIFYDPPPHSLTRGQLSRTYCYSFGLQIAALRYPMSGNGTPGEHEFTKRHSPCPDPYDVSPDARAPRSPYESYSFWEQAYAASQTQGAQTTTVPWITASEWTANGTTFSVTANIANLLYRYGPGVYTVLSWGVMGGEDVPISLHSTFYGVAPPDTYNAAAPK